MAYLVVGTAGHIDHGKSSLVRVLSGINPDRLKEEKQRGITIDLGFAYIQLPGGNTLAIVDVPGHERFIKNMLAGVAGIDLALLIVAADEGIMPQTREHFAILRLLNVEQLMVVITKTDLVDAEWLPLLKEELRDFLAGTEYKEAPIFTFSAVTQAGKEEILAALNQAARELPTRRKEEGIVRLPIDRVFTMPGFGTVVTGTLFSGQIAVGDQLYIPTKNKRVRVRNLQVHSKNVERAQVGQRVAVNLAGVEQKELERGDVLTVEGKLIPSQRVDVSLFLLESAEKPLRNHGRIRFHQGTSEVIGRIVLWDREELRPGEKAFAQLVLDEPVVLQKEDRYVIRRYSPLTTIGGGTVIEPVARKHKKRDLAQTLEEMNLKAQGSPEEVIYLTLTRQKKLLAVEEIARQTGFSDKQVEGALAALQKVAAEGAEGGVVSLALHEGGPVYVPAALLKEWEQALRREINAYLQENPLEPGIKKELLRSRLFSGLELNGFNALLKHWEQQEKLAIVDGLYIAPFGGGAITGSWLEKIRAVENYYRDCGWQVPVKRLAEEALHLNEKQAAQVWGYLTRTGSLLQLSGDLYLPKELFLEAQSKLQQWFQENSDITVAQFRDLVGTSRKIAISLLEYLDRIKFTVRVGDKRTLWK